MLYVKRATVYFLRQICSFSGPCVSLKYEPKVQSDAQLFLEGKKNFSTHRNGQQSSCARLLDSVLPSHRPLNEEAQGVSFRQANPNPLQ